MIEMLRHNRIELALHHLRDATDNTCVPLLLLHALGDATPASAPWYTTDWPGAIYGLDFTGHGQSTVPAGGGYTAEVLIGDVDAALSVIGRAVLVGHGLGGYIGFLSVGAIPASAAGVVIADGPGTSGGPDEPTSMTVIVGISSACSPDPYALLELGRDLRPADYSMEFAGLIEDRAPLPVPVQVTARFRPPWLAAIMNEPCVAEAGSIVAALAALRSQLA